MSEKLKSQFDVTLHIFLGGFVEFMSTVTTVLH